MHKPMTRYTNSNRARFLIIDKCINICDPNMNLELFAIYTVV